MKLTQKDIMLLKWLVLFVLLFVAYQFAYKPIADNLSAKQIELEALVAQKEYTEITLPTYDAVLKTESETRLTLERRFNNFFDEFEADSLEAYLDPIFDKYNVRIDFFQAALTQVVIPEVLVDEKEILNYKIKVLLDEYEKNSISPIDPVIATSDLLKTKVTYRLDMSFTNYQLLIQELSELDTSILLSSSSYQLEDGVATLDFDVYSLQKFSNNP
ncbi:MAG TPA: hypothetical protein VFH18_08110 [Erysipelotrichaceae bacterium]|nr:hypothetical protein [Erysipelotrichaceae bacterium]